MLKESIKSWYMREYPHDLLANKIPYELSFAKFYLGLKNGENIYEMLGGKFDNCLRDRIFEELAARLNVDYDIIYNIWQKNREIKAEVVVHEMPPIDLPISFPELLMGVGEVNMEIGDLCDSIEGKIDIIKGFLNNIKEDKGFHEQSYDVENDIIKMFNLNDPLIEEELILDCRNICEATGKKPIVLNGESVYFPAEFSQINGFSDSKALEIIFLREHNRKLLDGIVDFVADVQIVKSNLPDELTLEAKMENFQAERESWAKNEKDNRAKKLIEKAIELGWKMYSDFGDGFYELGIRTPLGDDHILELINTENNPYEIIDAIREIYEEFDLSEQVSLRLKGDCVDENGKEFGVKEVLEDMKWFKEKLKSLYSELSEYLKELDVSLLDEMLEKAKASKKICEEPKTEKEELIK